jgi:hypothetical protein
MVMKAATDISIVLQLAKNVATARILTPRIGAYSRVVVSNPMERVIVMPGLPVNLLKTFVMQLTLVPSRTQLMLLLAILCLSQVARGQFVWQAAIQPGEAGNNFDFNCLSCFASSCTSAGIITNPDSTVLPRSVIYYTKDGGNTWCRTIISFREQVSIRQNRILAVKQIDSLNVIAVGDSMILSSSDGGAHWIDGPCPAGVDFIAVHFSDVNTGIVVSSNGFVYFTHDAGQSWSEKHFIAGKLPIGCYSDGERSFRLITNPYGVIYSTKNDWETYDSTRPIFYKNSDTSLGPDDTKLITNWNVNGDTILAFGNQIVSGSQNKPFRGLLARTVDGGKHWRHIILADSFYHGVSCSSQLDRDTIFVGGQAREKLIRSDDRGETWKFDSVACKFIDSTYLFTWTIGIQLNNFGLPIGAFSNSYLPGASFIGLGKRTNYSEVYPRTNHSGETLYPNPATTYIQMAVTWRNAYIIDPLGRVFSVDHVQSPLDISALKPGMYYVTDGTQCAKFIKE